MLNMGFNQYVVIETRKMDWENSPIMGVKRKRLAFQELESGHATSIIQFEANAKFRRHGHPLGEEIFVLEGVFSDETGNYPAGTYLRNPAGFEHNSFSENGCRLLVKLNQFQEQDTQRIIIDTHFEAWQPGHGNLQVISLHHFEGEHTALVKWPAGEHFTPHQHVGGEEIYVISGVFRDEHGRYPAGTWIRSPHSSSHNPFVEEDTIIFVKTGHIPLEQTTPKQTTYLETSL